VIDPRRKQQNNERAADLLEFMRKINRLDTDTEEWKRLSAELSTLVAKNWSLPAHWRELAQLPLPESALRVAERFAECTIEPLRQAIKAGVTADEPEMFTIDGTVHVLHEPDDFTTDRVVDLVAPLTAHVCPDLAHDVIQLHNLVFDPTKNKPLGIERAYYARERAKLIWVENWLWQSAWAYGGATDRIPYANRFALLFLVWLPVAHQPPGSWTVCIRCGALLHRKRESPSVPRCRPCMKETPKQREWPSHAVAPLDRGNWLLNCQFPGCGTPFAGPRHRKYCPEHVTATLPPSKRQRPHQV
jgi:hypothetical protein